MRRCLALLALAVTTWSNVAVLGCTPTRANSSETEAEAPVGHAGHAGHGDSRHDHDAPASEDGPASHPVGNDCGVVMACGTALGGQSAMNDRALPAAFTEIATVTLASPSAADLSRDPPPPRRHA